MKAFLAARLRFAAFAKNYVILPITLLSGVALSQELDAQTQMYGESSEEIQATVNHLKKTIPAYKAQIEKIKQHNPAEAQWQQGQDLKEFGLETLREMGNKKSSVRTL